MPAPIPAIRCQGNPEIDKSKTDFVSIFKSLSKKTVRKIVLNHPGQKSRMFHGTIYELF